MTSRTVRIYSNADFAAKRHLLPAATEVYVGYCPGLIALDLPAATEVKVGYCPGLIALDLPAATEVDVWGCPGLTALDAPAATEVEVWRCPGLTALDAPAAMEVKVWHCPGLTALHKDDRGYTLYAVPTRRGTLYTAGCRCFLAAKALAHWGGDDYPDKKRGARFVRAIKKHEAKQ